MGALPYSRYNVSRSSQAPDAIDYTCSMSSLKMKILKPFSGRSADNEPIGQNDNGSVAPAARKSRENGGRFSRPIKDTSGKGKENSLKHAISDLRLQSHFSQVCHDMPSSVVDERVHPVRGNSHVNNVLQELISTEKSYVRDLRDIEEGYRVPMSHDRNFSEEDIRSVFSNITHIYDFNKKLLKRLKKHRLDALQVCQVFLDNRDGFNVYTDYCTNYQRSVETLERCKDQAECHDFVMNCQRLLKHPLPLLAYLFKPVQRILKYHLLLKSLAEHWDSSSPGFEVVAGAHGCMLQVADDINEAKRIQEESAKVARLLASVQGLDGLSAESVGGLVLAGEMVPAGSREESRVFLMAKAILVTKRRKDSTLALNAIIMSSNLVLVEIIPGEPLAFRVMGFGEPKKQCTLRTRSEEEKNVWCKEIKKVILDSIKANVPERARLLLMRPGLRQEAEESEVVLKMTRNVSENLDHLVFAGPNGNGPKTGTSLQSMLRSVLRKSSLSKSKAIEKKGKTDKPKVDKRLGVRSLGSLNIFSSRFRSSPAGDQTRAGNATVAGEEGSQTRVRDVVERLPAEEGVSRPSCDPLDPNSSPERSSSFERTLDDSGIDVCAFCRDARRFVPKRSRYYVRSGEQWRSLSVTTVCNVRESEESLAPGDLKLALSEDCLLISPSVDGDAEEPSKAAETETKDEAAEGTGEVPARTKDGEAGGRELPSSRNGGVAEESFEKIKVGKESGSSANGTSSCEKAADKKGEIPEKDEAPILREEPESSHLLGNRKCNYVFRLARAYSYRFKRRPGFERRPAAKQPTPPPRRF